MMKTISRDFYFLNSLQKLAVEWAEDKQDLIPPFCCPRLTVLRGTQGVVETFLPGRKIASLSWMSHSLNDPAFKID